MRALMLLLSLTLAGCTVGPDYVRPGVDIPEGWRTTKADAQDIANTAWWRLFEDPVLDGMIRTALASNKDVHLAAARIDEFAARIGIADAAARPQVDFGASAAREGASAELPGGIPAGIGRTNDFYAATINVGWELDVWGRIRRASEAARAELLEADEGRRTVLLTLVSSVATSYIELRSLDKQLDIANRTLESRDETLRLFELQRAGGVVSDLEVAQIRSEYEQAALQIPFIEQQIALLENSISVLLGRNPGPIDRGRSIDDLVLPPIPSGVPSDLLARRPDIRSAEQAMIAANARIGEARAAFFPRIALTGFFGGASDDLSNLVTSSAAVWSAGGSLLSPIFTGGALTSRVEVSEAVQRQTVVVYLQTIETAFREVDDALVSNQKTREQLTVQERQVSALMDYARLARLRYDNGYVSFIEVLDSERRLFGAELAQVQIKSSVYAALVNTYKAMGGGWVLHAETLADTRPGDAATPEPARPLPRWMRFPQR